MRIASDSFGNPSSNHRTGLAASNLVKESRKHVAAAVGMSAQDVIFTSGATEANNLALLGLRRGVGRPIRVLVGATEHKSVLEACRALKEDGSHVELIPVDESGSISIKHLREMLENVVDLVSIGAANGETGVMNDMCAITSCVHERGALIHCDATQIVGRVPFDAIDLDLDMITFSAHKMYGPKGCGALVTNLYARRQLSCIMHGGGQENGLRSGTLNVPAIVGFGTACNLISEGIEDSERQQHMRDEFEKKLSRVVPGMSVNGVGAKRLPNTSNVRIEGVLSDALVSRLPTVEIATGSACSSNSPMPSHVLLAMGLDDAAAYESFRVSIGRETTQDDTDRAVTEISETAYAVRRAMEIA